jgi:hypothetical protein
MEGFSTFIASRPGWVPEPLSHPAQKSAKAIMNGNRAKNGAAPS